MSQLPEMFCFKLLHTFNSNQTICMWTYYSSTLALEVFFHCSGEFEHWKRSVETFADERQTDRQKADRKFHRFSLFQQMRVDQEMQKNPFKRKVPREEGQMRDGQEMQTNPFKRKVQTIGGEINDSAGHS